MSILLARLTAGCRTPGHIAHVNLIVQSHCQMFITDACQMFSILQKLEPCSFDDARFLTKVHITFLEKAPSLHVLIAQTYQPDFL